jgi:hypothetical protein
LPRDKAFKASEAGELPNLISRCLVRMAVLERGNYRLNQLVGHHQFYPPLFDLFNHARMPDKRLTTVQRAKLALAQHLPGAAVVVADASTTCGEHSGLDHFHMARWDEEGEFVHP